jgi:hypothetical protein
MIRLLVALYPRKWRDSFGEDFAALLEDTRLTPRAVFDVMAHAGKLHAGSHRRDRAVRAAERISLRPGDARYRLSRLSAMVLLASFLIGIVVGAVEYTHRSPAIERHMAGANAITVHVVLAIAAAAAVIGIQARRSRRPPQREYSPWAAPLSASALTRLSRTILFAHGLSPPAPLASCRQESLSREHCLPPALRQKQAEGTRT